MAIDSEGQPNPERIKQLIEQLILLVQQKQLLFRDKEERKILENLLQLIIALLDSRSKLKKVSRSNSRKRGVRPTETGLIKMKEAKATKGLTIEKLADKLAEEKKYLSPSTIKRFLNGQNVDLKSAILILEVLNLDPNDILE